MRGWVVAALAASLAACAQPAPEKVTPALWQVDGPHGERGFLFGTIHALPKEADWRSAKVNAALAGSDSLVLEIARLDDDAATAAIFVKLARTPGQPLLSQRITPPLRPELAAVLRRTGLFETEFSATETWAAALTLAQRLQGQNNSGYGIDRALLNAAHDKAVGELEGAETQLGVFDALPEAEQRDLLAAVVAGADDEPASVAAAWSKGDMAVIERETHTGILSDPELRAVLLVNRNKAWTGRIVALLAQGERPFVAAGAAHMAGPDGLPALLAAQGYKVTRVQ